MNPLEPQIKKEDGIKDFLIFTAITIVIVLPIRMFIAQPFVVDGSSMSPNFESGQYLIVDELSYRLREPERGEVVIFKYPNDTSKFFIKRIIGLPSETVKIESGEVSITSPDKTKTTKLEEDYIKFPKDSNAYLELTEDEYFVMGDNRAASLDSRTWGALNKSYLVGRALLRLLPLDNISLLPANINFQNE